MSCCNQCGGCGCSACNYTVVLPTPTESDLIFNNINVIGVGVLDSATLPNINFRGVASASPELTVVLDNGNHAIVLTLDVAAIVAAIPQATTTVAGIGETSTDAEAQAMASILVFLTPSNLAALVPSTTTKGLVEMATNAEAIAGASVVLGINPSNLAAVVATIEQTTTFADAVARAALAPAFDGQYGFQVDTNQPYIAFGVAAGNWSPMIRANISNAFNGVGVATSIFFQAATFDFQGGGTGILTFADGQYIFDTTAVINFRPGSVITEGGVAIPANSTLVSGAVDGNLTSKLISEYISTDNTQTGWAVTNPVVNRALDVSAATLGDLRQVVGTLINDLKGVKLPAT